MSHRRHHRFMILVILNMILGVIDQISQELENWFDEINMELLSCMSALNPANSFAAFDAQKVCKLASKIGIESFQLICFF